MSVFGSVVAVCVGERRCVGKKSVGQGYLQRDFGLEGDAHAGQFERQVSLVAIEDVEAVNAAKGLQLGPGDCAAIIAVAGLALAGLPIGTRLRVGQATLEITRIGKGPTLAHRFSYCGISVLVDRGVFCRVISSGLVREGDIVTICSE